MYMMYRKNNQPIKTQASSWPQFKSGMGLLVIIDDIQLNCTFIKLGVRPKQPAVSSTYGVFPPNSKHHLNLQNICLPVPSLIHQPVVTGKKKTQRGTETSMELNFTISKYNNTVYHVHTALFYSISPQIVPTFFQRNTSSESNYNRNFQGRPVGFESIDCSFLYIYTCPSLESHKIDTKSYSLIPTTFIWISTEFYGYRDHF